MYDRNLFKFELFICILTFIFLFFPKDTYALTYTANNDCEYTVDSAETLRDYFYFTNIYNHNEIAHPVYSVFKNVNDTDYSIMYLSSSFDNPLTTSNSYYGYRSSTSCGGSFGSITSMTCYDSNFNSITCFDNYLTRNLLFDKWTPLYFNTKYILCSDSTTTNANFSTNDIISKYENLTCSSEPEEPSEEEIGMFDVVETFLIQFINILPFIIPFILVVNLCCRMLFNERS